MSRIPYIFLFFVAGVFAIVMSLYGESELDLGFYSSKFCSTNTCEGNGSVYRVSFLLFAFELIHVLIIGAGAISFHWLWFGIKFLVFAAGLTVSFIVGVDDGSSNAFFDGYAAYFARYVSALYLLLQILILIVWGHNVNEWLQFKAAEAAQPDNEDQDEDERSHSCNGYIWALVGATVALYVASFTLCGLFFEWYGDTDTSDCAEHRTLISLTIVIVILNGVISAVVGDGSLFASAVVSFYCTFLCFAALQSDDDDTCNVWAGQRDSASLWIGYMVTFVAIFYAAVRADRLGLLWDVEDDEESMERPLLDGADKSKDVEKGDDKSVDGDIVADSNYNDVASDDGKKQEPAEETQTQSKQAQRISNSLFHFIMMLAACYMAMLFSNWGTGSTLQTTGKTTMWVNIVSQYAAAILFWWTLIAPKVCPSRFGSDDEDED